MTELRFDRRMSEAEGLMWRLEKDPYLSSTFGSVSVLDCVPDRAKLRARLDRATVLVPRLRQRVQPAPANLAAPSWVDDTTFDLDNHLRWLAVPAPGTDREMFDLVSGLLADPFDRTRPLWTFYVIEGLVGGRAALVQKLHHTVVDGEGGVQLSLQYLDMERESPQPPPLGPEQVEALRASSAAPANPAEMLRDAVIGASRVPLAVAGGIRSALRQPARIPEAGVAAFDSAKAVVGQLSDTDPARSPLWTERSLRRRVETLQVPFRAAKDAARAMGGTLNTLFVAAAADAAGAYHRRMGSPVEDLRTSMAISSRTASSGSNAFSLARVLVPTGEMTPEDRFRTIHERTTSARSGSGSASLELLAGVTAALPTSLITRIARQQSQTVDFATSNVRGSPFPVFVAGAQLLGNYPVGPLGGVAFNLTLLSYHGSLDMGVNIDTAAVAEPEVLRDELAAAFARYLG